MSTATIERSYMGWQEAARFSGLSISTLRRLAKEGRLTVFRPTQARALLSARQLVEVIEGRDADQE